MYMASPFFQNDSNSAWQTSSQVVTIKDEPRKKKSSTNKRHSVMNTLTTNRSNSYNKLSKSAESRRRMKAKKKRKHLNTTTYISTNNNNNDNNKPSKNIRDLYTKTMNTSHDANGRMLTSSKKKHHGKKRRCYILYTSAFLQCVIVICLTALIFLRRDIDTFFYNILESFGGIFGINDDSNLINIENFVKSLESKYNIFFNLTTEYADIFDYPSSIYITDNSNPSLAPNETVPTAQLEFDLRSNSDCAKYHDSNTLVYTLNPYNYSILQSVIFVINNTNTNKSHHSIAATDNVDIDVKWRSTPIALNKNKLNFDESNNDNRRFLMMDNDMSSNVKYVEMDSNSLTQLNNGNGEYNNNEYDKKMNKRRKHKRNKKSRNWRNVQKNRKKQSPKTKKQKTVKRRIKNGFNPKYVRDSVRNKKIFSSSSSSLYMDNNDNYTNNNYESNWNFANYFGYNNHHGSGYGSGRSLTAATASSELMKDDSYSCNNIVPILQASESVLCSFEIETFSFVNDVRCRWHWSVVFKIFISDNDGSISSELELSYSRADSDIHWWSQNSITFGLSLVCDTLLIVASIVALFRFHYKYIFPYCNCCYMCEDNDDTDDNEKDNEYFEFEFGNNDDNNKKTGKDTKKRKKSSKSEKNKNKKYGTYYDNKEKEMNLDVAFINDSNTSTTSSNDENNNHSASKSKRLLSRKWNDFGLGRSKTTRENGDNDATKISLKMKRQNKRRKKSSNTSSRRARSLSFDQVYVAKKLKKRRFNKNKKDRIIDTDSETSSSSSDSDSDSFSSRDSFVIDESDNENENDKKKQQNENLNNSNKNDKMNENNNATNLNNKNGRNEFDDSHLHLLKSNRYIESSNGKIICIYSFHFWKRHIRWRIFLPISHISSLSLGICYIVNLTNVYDLNDSNALRFLLGFATLLAWCNLIFVVEARGTKFAAFFHTMRIAFIPLMQLILASIPIYLGYTFCGAILFGIPDGLMIFATPEYTAKTLYAVMLGDEVLTTFYAAGVGTWYAEIFMYSWSILFIAVIFNIALMIIATNFFTILPALEQNRDEHDTKSLLPPPNSFLDWDINNNNNDDDWENENSKHFENEYSKEGETGNGNGNINGKIDENNEMDSNIGKYQSPQFIEGTRKTIVLYGSGNNTMTSSNNNSRQSSVLDDNFIELAATPPAIQNVNERKKLRKIEKESEERQLQLSMDSNEEIANSIQFSMMSSGTDQQQQHQPPLVMLSPSSLLVFPPMEMNGNNKNNSKQMIEKRRKIKQRSINGIMDGIYETSLKETKQVFIDQVIDSLQQSPIQNDMTFSLLSKNLLTCYTRYFDNVKYQTQMYLKTLEQ